MLVCLATFLLFPHGYHPEYSSQQDKLQHIAVHHENLCTLYIFLELYNISHQKLVFEHPQNQLRYHLAKSLSLLIWFRLYISNRLLLRILLYLGTLVRRRHN